MSKLLEAIKKQSKKGIETAIDQDMAERLAARIQQEKTKMAKNIVVEDAKEPEIEKSPIDKPPAPALTRTQPAAGQYRYQFPFMGKIYIVNFVPSDTSSTKFQGWFHAKGQDKAKQPFTRYGISKIDQIQRVFPNILKAVETFLKLRKPQTVRFGPGPDMKFPPTIHQYLYPVLKDFSDRPDIKKTYTVIRGDSIKDGSAFAIRRGAQQSNLKAKSWKPGQTAPTPEPQKEDIANVSGAAVATDRPTKPPLGLPGLAKATAMERRKKPR